MKKKIDKTIEKLIELKELHYRGYLNDEEYIDKVNEILSKYIQEYNAR